MRAKVRCCWCTSVPCTYHSAGAGDARPKTVSLILSPSEAQGLEAMAVQMEADYQSQANRRAGDRYDHAGGATAAQCRAGLAALEKLRAAIGGPS